MAAVATLSACQNDDITANENVDNGSPVEIKLASSTGAVSTRGSIESDEKDNFAVKGVGIFCLAKTKQGVNPNEAEISWAKGTEFSVVLENEEANVDTLRDAADNLYSQISWADPTAVHYYPTGNWYSYDFYGYYPYSNDVEWTETTRTVTYELDGTKDIIWGKATSDEAYAYSARYFRQAANKDKTPEVKFEHKLMRITFTYEAGEDYEGAGTYGKAEGMIIESIQIHEAPTQATLVIADKASEGVESEEGKLLVDWNTDTFAPMSLLDQDDQPWAENAYKVELDESGLPIKGKKIGQGILLPVPEDPNFRYSIDVVLKLKDGSTLLSTEHPIELRNGAAYQANHSYNVNMKINAGKLIELNSTLKAWVNDDTNIGEVEF